MAFDFKMRVYEVKGVGLWDKRWKLSLQTTTYELK